jgi:hypothetical protein
MQGTERPFVWSRCGAEAGQELDSLILRKEAERIAGQNVFWWGIGSSLGPNVRQAASNCAGELDVQFSAMLMDAQEHDSNPEEVWVWTHWTDANEHLHKLPPHVIITSRGRPRKTTHYALICQSAEPLQLRPQPFDLARCDNYKSWNEQRERKKVGGRQSTFLVLGNFNGDHSKGKYKRGFRAKLIDPWCVRLTKHRVFTSSERRLLDSWKAGGDWPAFARQFQE